MPLMSSFINMRSQAIFNDSNKCKIETKVRYMKYSHLILCAVSTAFLDYA